MKDITVMTEDEEIIILQNELSSQQMKATTKAREKLEEKLQEALSKSRGIAWTIVRGAAILVSLK